MTTNVDIAPNVETLSNDKIIELSMQIESLDRTITILKSETTELERELAEFKTHYSEEMCQEKMTFDRLIICLFIVAAVLVFVIGMYFILSLPIPSAKTDVLESLQQPTLTFEHVRSIHQLINSTTVEIMNTLHMMQLQFNSSTTPVNATSIVN